MVHSLKNVIHSMTSVAPQCCICKKKCSYASTEDHAVEDGHGDSDSQRLPFGDTNVELWCLTWADITAEEEWNLLRDIHYEAASGDLEDYSYISWQRES